MYRLLGVRSDAWLTEKAEAYRSPNGIGNYGLVPVTYKNTDAHWEKTKKEIGEDFQKLQKSAVTASKKTRDYIKRNSKRNPGYPVGLGLGLLGVAAKYSSIEGIEELGDPLICGGFFMTARQIVYNARRAVERSRERKKMRIERVKIKAQQQLHKEQIEIQKEIRDLLKELKRTPVNGDIHRKIGYKGRLEDLLKSIDDAEYMEPECIEKIRKEEVKPIKESLEKLYRV